MRIKSVLSDSNTEISQIFKTLTAAESEEDFILALNAFNETHDNHQGVRYSQSFNALTNFDLLLLDSYNLISNSAFGC